MKKLIDILVVDDEKVILDSIERICSFEKLKTNKVYSVTEAIENIKKNNYRLIICDIMLPEIDGFQLLEYLRTSDIETPVIMTTGYSTVENAVQSLYSGAIDFLPKPFTSEELCCAIHRGLKLADIQYTLKHPEKNNNNDSVLYVPCPPKYLRLGHYSWVFKEFDGSALVGITDLFLKTINSVTSINLKTQNVEIVQGYSCAKIETDDCNEHMVMSPITGRIIEVNNKIESDVSIIEKNPYFEGWFYRLIPSNYEQEIEHLISCSTEMF